MQASPALLALRRATAADHSALEEEAAIEPRLADPATRPQTVLAFHRFHAALEATAHPLVTGLDAGFAPVSRGAMIAGDLADLGRPAPRTPPVGAPGSVGAALGWVYVAEGSMLGGRIIRRRLGAAGIDLTGLSFLDPHGEETGARWRAFLHLLDAACANGRAEIADVVQGGLEGFAHARRTLHPDAMRAAA